MTTEEVYAYGGMHEALSFDVALAYARDWIATDADGTRLSAVRVSRNGYELVGFGVDAEGFEFQGDSDYVTEAVALRLFALGVIDVHLPEQW
jgi:hypothetical protein